MEMQEGIKGDAENKDGVKDIELAKEDKNQDIEMPKGDQSQGNEAVKGKMTKTRKPFKKRGKCATGCFNCLALLFSTVGLSVVLAGYALMGALIFHWLELSKEKETRTDVRKIREKHLKSLKRLTTSVALANAMDKAMLDFQHEVVDSIFSDGWDGKDEDTDHMRWSFVGSLLYSITVITTIGYGQVTPKSEGGKIITILYALFGIPLTLLFLSDIGSMLGDAARICYRRIVLTCCKRKERKGSQNETPHKQDTTQNDENNSKPKEKDLKTKRKINESEGKTQPTSGRSNSGPRGSESKESSMKFPTPLRRKQSRRNSSKAKNNQRKLKRVKVPIFFIIVTIIGYTMGGAAMFSAWGIDCSFLDAYYFSFTTLTTIGFGDFVSGRGNQFDENWKICVCLVYLVFGLTIVAMSFDLLKENASYKVNRKLIKMGLIEETRGRNRSWHRQSIGDIDSKYGR